MKLCRLERFTRHLVISFQLLWSFALWKLLPLLELEGEQEGGEMWPWEARSLCSQIISGLLKPLGTVSKNCLLQKKKFKNAWYLSIWGIVSCCYLLSVRGKGNRPWRCCLWLSLFEPTPALWGPCGSWGLQEHPPAQPKCRGAQGWIWGCVPCWGPCQGRHSRARGNRELGTRLQDSSFSFLSLLLLLLLLLLLSSTVF